MSACALLADEVTAAGFRLAGVEVHVPDDAELAQRFTRLCDETRLLLITAELAERLPAGLLSRQQRASRTLILVLGDVRGRREPEELGASLRRQLGMAE
jgi:vacuolar-type H+-ATPase subunit F/Vma7